MDEKTEKLTWQWQLEKYVWSLTFAGCCYFLYTWIGEFTAARQTAFYLEIDNWVPFWPWTVWCYLPFYVLIFHVSTFSIRKREIYFRTLGSIAIGMVICCAFFLSVPSSYPRPDLPDGTHYWHVSFLQWVRQIDVANNTFPSSHVALSFACALSTFRDNKRSGLVTIGMALCLAVSILTTKQHYVVDSFGGLLVGYIAYRIAFWNKPHAAPARVVNA
ncbi:MAG: phosphatase PAP2 family protein [Deltaproteobacteria bacterium]|nr:phosphatase PAP2 family protein [Deltaproteobacteria bacterium]